MSTSRLGFALLVLVAAQALAVGRGGVLYVCAVDTRVLASARPAAPVLAVLQPGQQVIWAGADRTDKRYHRVIFEGKAGVVLPSGLCATMPAKEVMPIDPRAFCSAGAAVKGFDCGPPAFEDPAARELFWLERLAASVTPAECEEHAKRARLSSAGGKK